MFLNSYIKNKIHCKSSESLEIKENNLGEK